MSVYLTDKSKNNLKYILIFKKEFIFIKKKYEAKKKSINIFIIKIIYN
jgi:hypothetical protein